MRAAKKKVSDITIDELKEIIHSVMEEDLNAWRETFEIMGDKKLMSQLRQADKDWQKPKKGDYVSWDALKRV